MIALLAITNPHCHAFVNIKGILHSREISSAFAHNKSKRVSVFCACYLEITLADGSRGLLYLMYCLSENLTIFISFLARFTDKRNNPWGRTISVLKSSPCLSLYFFSVFKLHSMGRRAELGVLTQPQSPRWCRLQTRSPLCERQGSPQQMPPFDLKYLFKGRFVKFNAF